MTVGQFVRIGPNTLSINSETALKSIYGFKANVRKSDFYLAFAAKGPQTLSTHSSIDKHIHARKRRIMSHGFSDQAMRSMERFINWEIDTFCRVVYDRTSALVRPASPPEEAEGWSSAKNIAKLCDWLAFDIMGNLVFGKAFDMLETPSQRFAVDLVSSAAHRHNICGTYPPLYKTGMDKYLLGNIAANRARYMQYSKEQMTQRTKQGLEIDRKDFFYHLLNAKDPETGHGFSTSELWGESNLLIIAGSDTTSTSLAATFFYLVHNLAALQKATAEVRAAFTSPAEIVHGPKLTSCAYLRACIDEAMRLCPPVGGGLPRTVLSGGLHVDGAFVGEGATVMVPHYALHHNAACFPDPFAFRPERWSAATATPDLAPFVDKAQAAFCAFSIGPRGCIGRGLAYVEMTTTMARCLFQYDVRLAPGTHLGEGGRWGKWEWGTERESEYQTFDTFTSVKDGPAVQFKKVA